MLAHFFQISPAPKAIRFAGFNNDKRNTPRALLRIGLGDDNDKVGMLAV